MPMTRLTGSRPCRSRRFAEVGVFIGKSLFFFLRRCCQFPGGMSSLTIAFIVGIHDPNIVLFLRKIRVVLTAVCRYSGEKE